MCISLSVVRVPCWSCGRAIHMWGHATARVPVLSFTRYLPVYFPIKAKRRMSQLGLVDHEVVERERLLRKTSAPDSGQLHYPLQPLVCSADKATLPNILFVVVDALRPDKISPESTPRIARFAAEVLRVSNHYSGGNSSRMGFFSMVYGLPSTYWQAFNDTQPQPVLMDTHVPADYRYDA